MSDLPTKRVASWPTLRDETLVVDIKHPAPGQAVIDIRRYKGPDPDNLVPSYVGATLDSSEITLLQAALAKALVILEGGVVETSEPPKNEIPEAPPLPLKTAPPMPSFLRDMMERHPGKPEAAPAQEAAPAAVEPAVEQAPEAAEEVPEPPRRRSGFSALWR